MKRSLLIIIGTLMMVSDSFSSKKIITKDRKQLPPDCKQFINNNFKEADISHINIESGVFGVKYYLVTLTNGTGVGFNNKGEWIEINSHNKSIPNTIIPNKILTYIKQNFVDNTIVSIEKDNHEYDIKLSGGILLIFNNKEELEVIVQ